MDRYVKTLRLVSIEDVSAVVGVCVSKMIQCKDSQWSSLVSIFSKFLRQTCYSWSLRFETPSLVSLDDDIDKAIVDKVFFKTDCAGDLVTQSCVLGAALQKDANEWVYDGERRGFYYTLQRSGQTLALATAVIIRDSVSTLVIQSRSCLGTVWCHGYDGCVRSFDVLPWREGSEEGDGLPPCTPRIRECMKMDSLLGKRTCAVG